LFEVDLAALAGGDGGLAGEFEVARAGCVGSPVEEAFDEGVGEFVFGDVGGEGASG
jgi:hypothetical protein